MSLGRCAAGSVIELCTCQGGVGKVLRGFKLQKDLRVVPNAKRLREPGRTQGVDVEAGSSSRDHGHQEWVPVPFMINHTSADEYM